MLKCITRLWFIHIISLLTILFSMYFPVFDVVLSLVFLVFIYLEGRLIVYKTNGSLWQVSVIALSWQFPALLLILVNTFDLSQFTALYHYSYFMLEIWQTQLLPLLSLIPPTWTYQGMPLYYYLYFIDIPLLMFLLILPTLQYRIRRK